MYSASNINSPFEATDTGLEIKKLEIRPSENILPIFERPNFQFSVKINLQIIQSEKLSLDVN